MGDSFRLTKKDGMFRFDVVSRQKSQNETFSVVFNPSLGNSLFSRQEGGNFEDIFDKHQDISHQVQLASLNPHSQQSST